MNKETFEKILKLTNNFYENNAKDFSASRKYSWRGWKSLNHVIKNNFRKSDQISILDLGCGNGRFYKYSLENLKGIEFTYLGLDSIDNMIIEAKENVSLQNYTVEPNFSYKKWDVIKDIDRINEAFDIVVAFGLTHHIPSREFRKNWFNQIPNLVSDGGLFIFTIWKFNQDQKLKNKVTKEIKLPNLTIEKKDLENGDYFLGWNDKKDSYRYSHTYSQKELEEVNLILEKKNMKLIGKYKADGKNNELNEYFIYNKLDS